MDSLETALKCVEVVQFYQDRSASFHMPALAFSMVLERPVAYIQKIKCGPLGASTHMTTIIGSWNGETKAYLNLGIGDRVFDSWAVSGPFVIELITPFHVRNMLYCHVTLDFYASPTTVSQADSLTAGGTATDAPELFLRQLEGVKPISALRYLLNSKGEIYVTFEGFGMTLDEYQHADAAAVRQRVERMEQLEGKAEN